MPNILYMLLNLAYHVSLAVWIGGAIALGALTAPELFRQLPRQQAGGIFGPILRRFARLRLGVITIAILAAAVRGFLYEQFAVNLWILARWTCLLFLAVAVIREIYWLEPAMERYRSAIRPDGGDDDPNRIAFMGLHRNSEDLMKISVVAALIAVFVG